MITIAENIYPQSYLWLSDIVQAIQHEQSGRAKKLIKETKMMLIKHQGSVSDEEIIQADLFLNALEKRLSKNKGSQEEENLYLLPDQSQQIKLFNFMAENFPVVQLSQQIVNKAITERVQQHRHITVIDIGMGTGWQMSNLIKDIASTTHQITHIRFIGIEPSKESLTTARQTILNTARNYQIPASFTAIHSTVQAMSYQTWFNLFQIAEKKDSAFFINASFALHHINPIQKRLALFKNLKSMNPILMTLIEPYSNHTILNLKERFKYAWHHYGLVFKAIDGIQASIEDKKLVKSIFFGREIQDAMSTNQHRVEQFETAEMWLSRLGKAHFRSVDFMPYIPAVNIGPNLSIVKGSEYISVAVESYPIVSIIGCE